MWGHALYVSGGPRSHGRISWTIPCLPYKSLRWSYLVQHSLTVASTQNQHTVYQSPPPPFSSSTQFSLFFLGPPSLFTRLDSLSLDE
jgi:hypothetical protein